MKFFPGDAAVTIDVSELQWTRRKPLLAAVLLVLVLASALMSCREKLPLNGDDSSSQRTVMLFSPGDYFVYDNWKLDGSGRKIGNSYFRNTWTVADTGRTLLGSTRVTIIIDSTFSTAGHFQRLDTVYIRVAENGDLFQYGFLYRLIAERESLNIFPSWDRIAAFSVPRGQSWVIARIDTSRGEGRIVNIVGRIVPAQEYVGLIVNGQQRAVLSHRINISKPKLDYTFWVTDSPSAVLRAVDESTILTNIMLKEIGVMFTLR
jgi:hypothetical protein